MKKIRIFQFYYIFYFVLIILALYSLVDSKQNKTVLDVVLTVLFILLFLSGTGFNYSYDNQKIYAGWFFFKRIRDISQVEQIEISQSRLKSIKIYFLFEEFNTSNYMDYKAGINISYILQKKNITRLINMISAINPECKFIVRKQITTYNNFIQEL